MFKKILAFGGTLGSAALALAEDSTTTYIDTTAATTALTGLKTQLVSFISTAAPVVCSIMGAFLVFWLIRFVYKLVKSSGSRS